MIRCLVVPLISVGALICTAAEPPPPRPDLLRFKNGDRLHGTYLGLKEREDLVVWKHPGAQGTVEFRPDQIRQIVLRTGRPVRSHETLSHVALVSGDRFPGQIVGLDKEFVTVETSYAGTLRIPRQQVGMLAPAPLGGKILYYGPFEEDRWQMVTPEFPEGLPTASAKEAVEPTVEAAPDEATDDSPEENAPEAATPPRWELSGAAWYWNDAPGGTALVQREGMSERSILRFEVAWQNRLSFAIAFHADFHQPEELLDDDDEANPRRANFGPGDVSVFPKLFGSGYVLHLHQHHLILFRTGFDARGLPTLDRLQSTTANMPLAESGNATVELRCNRTTGNIMLMLNGEFVAQWSEGGEGEGYGGKGNGFGFVVAAEKSPVRISDIVLAEWNGMPDSARSLQVDDQDIVLLANGTDRFSGEVTGLHEGAIHLTGRYGQFQFPLEEVAEIRFARNSLSPREASEDGSLGVRLHPLGKISGKPLAGDASSLKLWSPAVGEVTLDLKSAVVLEFDASDSFLDDWDPQF